MVYVLIYGKTVLGVFSSLEKAEEEIIEGYKRTPIELDRWKYSVGSGKDYILWQTTLD